MWGGETPPQTPPPAALRAAARLLTIACLVDGRGVFRADSSGGEAIDP